MFESIKYFESKKNVIPKSFDPKTIFGPKSTCGPKSIFGPKSLLGQKKLAKKNYLVPLFV